MIEHFLELLCCIIRYQYDVDMSPRMWDGNYMCFPAFCGTYTSCEIVGLKIDSTWGNIIGGIQTKVFPFRASICKGKLSEIKSEKTFAGHATKRGRRRRQRSNRSRRTRLSKSSSSRRERKAKGEGERSKDSRKWLAWHNATLC
jgi:hypothetical protein